MNLREALGQAPNRRLHRLESVEPVDAPRRRGRMQWVLSRALCHFTRVPLVRIANHSRDAVRLRARADAPFGEPAFAEDWHDGAVAIWCWDRALVWRVIEDAGFDPSRVRVIPEAALQERPGSDGVRLVTALDGVDAQLWRGGSLVASRWFATVPSDADWTLFQRGIALQDPQPHAPAPVSPRWLHKPWLSGAVPFLPTQVAPGQVAATIALIAGLALAWRAGEAIALGIFESRLDRQQMRGAVALVELEAARRNALIDGDVVQAIGKLDPFPSQLALLAAIAEKLPEESRITDWNWQGGDLAFTILASQEPVDVPNVVRSLSSVPLLSNLVADRSADGRGIVLRCRVRGVL
jgi:hypothetical protein